MKLVDARKDANKTQTEVAVAVGVTLMSYQNWERGNCKPTEKNLKKLKEVLGVDKFDDV